MSLTYKYVPITALRATPDTIAFTHETGPFPLDESSFTRRLENSAGLGILLSLKYLRQITNGDLVILDEIHKRGNKFKLILKPFITITFQKIETLRKITKADPH